MRVHHINGSADRRAGFSLVEILISIAIILVLAGMTANGLFQVLGKSREKQTKILVGKLSHELNRQWGIVLDQAGDPKFNLIPPQIFALAANTPPDANIDYKRAVIIFKKFRLRQQFPMNFYEAMVDVSATTGVSPEPSYQRQLQLAGFSPGSSEVVSPTVLQLQWENAILLYMALVPSRNGTKVDMETLVGRTYLTTVPNTVFPLVPGATNLKAIVDHNGQPVFFCRWPVGNPDVFPNGIQNYNRQAGLVDAVDPEGYLSNQTWVATNGAAAPAQPASYTAAATTFMTYIHRIEPRQCYPFTGPVVGAVGTNLKTGLLPSPLSQALLLMPAEKAWSTLPGAVYQKIYQMLPDGTGDDSDNVYSFDIK